MNDDFFEFQLQLVEELLTSGAAEAYIEALSQTYTRKAVMEALAARGHSLNSSAQLNE